MQFAKCKTIVQTLPGDLWLFKAFKALSKINGKLKFLYHKNKFLTPILQRMLSNALIQSHFDYTCSAWYPNLTEILKKIAENKCICFCLKLVKKHHNISWQKFQSINWLPVYKRVHWCINVIKFKGTLSVLRQFLATESPLKMMRNAFYSPQKLFSFERYLSFCFDLFIMYRNNLIRKIRLISNFICQPG